MPAMMSIISCRGFCLPLAQPEEARPSRGPSYFFRISFPEAKQNRRVVLIVDEAQTLGVNLLEELRLMSNMNQEKPFTCKLSCLASRTSTSCCSASR